MVLRDPVSSVTHLLAAVWAAYATVLLLRLSPPIRERRIALAIFGGSMVFLFLASGAFHAVPYTMAENPVEYRFVQTLDQSAIFVLIAGSNAPFMIVLLPGRWRLVCLAGMWGFALIGVACLWFVPKLPHAAMIGIYWSMGVLGLAPYRFYHRTIGWRPMRWAVLGGLFYSVGAFCELVEWPTPQYSPTRLGHHELFHVFVIAASASFYALVLRHVVRYRSPTADGKRSTVLQ